MISANRYVLGLDLGQMGDYSALVLLRYPRGDKPTYDVPTIHRWPLGTNYTAVGNDVARFLCRAELREADLVIDETGVGLAVVELVSKALAGNWLPNRVIRVTITGGSAVTQAGMRRWHVAKKQLVSTLSAVVHSERMRVAKDQPEANALVEEFYAFKVKVNLNTGNESFESWRERAHDDLVLAVALAVWWAEWPRPKAGPVVCGPAGGGTPMDSAFGGGEIPDTPWTRALKRSGRIG